MRMDFDLYASRIESEVPPRGGCLLIAGGKTIPSVNDIDIQCLTFQALPATEKL